MKIAIGDHFWALLDKKLVVVLSTEDGYFVAGQWECPIGEDEFSPIEIIPRPEKYSKTPLYYESSRHLYNYYGSEDTEAI